jgi:hypothetical protein
VENEVTMNAVVIKHVNVSELPADWRARVNAPGNTKVTVRIEEELAAQSTADEAINPMFGMWRDRDEMTDVDAYVRQLRSPRFR